MLLLANCGNAVVEQLTNDPKFEGFNPTIAEIGRNLKGA